MDDVNKCDRCGKHIPNGSAYVCITRNIEQMEHSVVDNDNLIEIIRSDQLVTFCGRCGNSFDSDMLVKLIGLIPGGCKAGDN